MIVYDNANPRGRDLGPRKYLHGNEVSLLARLDIARPLPEGKTWHDTMRQWLRPTAPSLGPRAPQTYTMECQQCGGLFIGTFRSRAQFCGPTCRQRHHRAKGRA